MPCDKDNIYTLFECYASDNEQYCLNLFSFYSPWVAIDLLVEKNVQQVSIPTFKSWSLEGFSFDFFNGLWIMDSIINGLFNGLDLLLLWLNVMI